MTCTTNCVTLLALPLQVVSAMNCPFCGYNDSKVIDSRDVNDGVRRRRQCLRCVQRFTTYERFQQGSLFVIKKDQRREEFSPEKLLSGIRKACGKRPLPSGSVEKLADEVEADLYRTGKSELSSTMIGDMVMERLRHLDNIAYIRFASVYRDFFDIMELKKLVDGMASGDSVDPPPRNQLPLIAPEMIAAPVPKRGVKKGIQKV